MTALERFHNNLPNPTIVSPTKSFQTKQYISKDNAETMPYVLLNITKPTYFTVDVDKYNSKFYWNFVGFLRPTLISENKENGHCHYKYETVDKNISLLKINLVLKALKYYLDSHKAFFNQKQLTYNDLYTGYNTYCYDRKYAIEELIGDYKSPLDYFISTNTKDDFIIDSNLTIYEGDRNEYLFNAGRKYAYSICKENNLFNLVFNYISTINEKQFDPVLETNEVMNMARNIAQWVFVRKNNVFSDKQRELSSKNRSEETINKILLAKKKCIDNKRIVTTAYIAELSGLSISTIERNRRLL